MLTKYAVRFLSESRCWRTEIRTQYGTGSITVEGEDPDALGAHIASISDLRLFESETQAWSFGLPIPHFRFVPMADGLDGQLTIDPAVGLESTDWIGMRCIIGSDASGSLPARIWTLYGPAIEAGAVSELAAIQNSKWSSPALYQVKKAEYLSGVSRAASRAAREWNNNPAVFA